MHRHAPISLPMRVLLFVLALAVVVALAAATAYGWGIKYYNSPGPNSEQATVIIPKGAGFQTITAMLHAQGVVEHPRAFALIALALDKVHRVKAGEYAFPAQVAPRDVLQSLVEGKTVVHRLTIPEGLTTAQIIALLNAEDKLEGNIPSDVKEGELLPETYYFSRGDSRAELISRMRRSMRELLMDLWNNRRANLPYRTPQEALTLASIVEKETGIANEYGMVASVYINRLRKGMKLQADPTVIYAITMGQEDFNRRVLYSDLRRESPYNTYYTTGLPPGPIANPGRGALMAALNPPETDYIFFVADGRGGHNFSTTYEQHSRYVREFRAKIRGGASSPAAASAEASAAPASAAPASTSAPTSAATPTDSATATPPEPSEENGGTMEAAN